MEQKKHDIVHLKSKIVSTAECQAVYRQIEDGLRSADHLLVLDFSRVEEISASFINFLATSIRQAGALQKKVAIVDPSNNLREMLDYTGLRPHLTVHETFEDLEMHQEHTPAILVIDDDQMMRDTTSEFVLQMGFHVLAAPGGEEGLALYRSEGHRVRLVILDLQMPGLSGEETLVQLRALDPQVRVVIVTGSMDTDRISYLQNVHGVPVLSKPFMMEDLEEALNKQLSNA